MTALRSIVFKVFLLLSCSCLANYSQMVIRSMDATLMLIKVDGIVINQIPQTDVRIVSLWPGNHLIEIKLIDNNTGETLKYSSTVYLDPQHESTFFLYHPSRNSHYLSLSSKVSLLQPVILQGSVTATGSASVYSPPVLVQMPGGNFIQQNITPALYDILVKNRPENLQKPEFDVCAELIRQSMMDSVIQNIRSHSMDSDRYRTAKLGVTANGLRVQDVRRILQEFSWDDTKLNFIRTSYVYICDKKNFFHLINQFKHTDTEKELEDYITAAGHVR